MEGQGRRGGEGNQFWCQIMRRAAQVVEQLPLIKLHGHPKVDHLDRRCWGPEAMKNDAYRISANIGFL